jgi:putative transposase
MATEFTGKYKVSDRRACAVLMLNRSTFNYQSRRDEQSLLRIRIKDLAYARPKYGYRRIHALLQREGWTVNHKRVYRLYMLEGLSLLAKRPKRHVSATRRRNFFNVTGPNSVWAMDFVSDALYSGKRIRALPIIDVFTRECLGIDVDHSIRGEQVVSALELIVATRGRPKTIHCDNGPEFISKVLDKWCYENGVELDFSRKGKPTDNAYVESFNGRFRDECLNFHWFMSLADARDKIEAWRREYNDQRPHYSLNFKTPSEFAHYASSHTQESEESQKSPI